MLKNKKTIALEILSQKKPTIKPLSQRLDPPARAKFLTLDQPTKDLYSLLTCQTCKIKLSIKEVSKTIMKGEPPLCTQHRKELNQELAKLAPLLKDLTSS